MNREDERGTKDVGETFERSMVIGGEMATMCQEKATEDSDAQAHE